MNSVQGNIEISSSYTRILGLGNHTTLVSGSRRNLGRKGIQRGRLGRPASDQTPDQDQRQIRRQPLRLHADGLRDAGPAQGRVSEIIHGYTCRWQIELFLKILKSGCRIEHVQRETAACLRRCLAVYAVVA